jgi:hypothetical protein
MLDHMTMYALYLLMNCFRVNVEKTHIRGFYMNIIHWDIYEITTKSSPITGVMYRGRLRKFALVHNRNILAENTTDVDKAVRFAIPHGEDPQDIIDFIKKLTPDAEVELVRKHIPNPVLSRLKVNIEDRYSIE